MGAVHWCNQRQAHANILEIVIWRTKVGFSVLDEAGDP
jgi:hypothetical protein